MKKVIVFLSAFIITILCVNFRASADTGPKPSITINIVGIDGDYIVAFAAKETSGPNYDYEDWKNGYGYVSYNPIMEYVDSDGFKWITRYYICNGNAEIAFTYYPPEIFKIVLYQNDELLGATKVMETYSFNSTFRIDYSINELKIYNTYNYWLEIFKFIGRLIITLVIEIGLFFLFRLYTKRNFSIVLLTNLVTQIALNIVLNSVIYYSGWLDAIILLFLCEFFICIIETTIYFISLKDKKKWSIILYGIVANLLSLWLGYILIRQL